jgi:hypothetical protein
MPQAVVYAYKHKGGLDLLYLYTKQGSSQVKPVISHLRSKLYIANSIEILLELYQLLAGMMECPLVNTDYHVYVNAPWIQSIRTFLWSIKGTVYIPDIKILQQLWDNDRTIMDSTKSNYFTKTELKSINACRIYLQVITISKITNEEGTQILPSVLHGKVDQNNVPALWKKTKSRLKWPRQPYPSVPSWKLWKKYLLMHLIQQTKVDPKLGH